MKSINKAQLIGHLGDDIKLTFFDSGGVQGRVSIATSSSWTNKDTGEIHEQTQWHTVIFHKGIAELVAKHMKKGSQMYVEGPIKYRKYTDSNGVERKITEIHCDVFQFLTESKSTVGQEKLGKASDVAQQEIDEETDKAVKEMQARLDELSPEDREKLLEEIRNPGGILNPKKE